MNFKRLGKIEKTSRIWGKVQGFKKLPKFEKIRKFKEFINLKKVNEFLKVHSFERKTEKKKNGKTKNKKR